MAPQQALAPTDEAQAVTIPCPLRGWNSRDAIDQMDPGFALGITNWYPDTQRLRLRGGSRVFASGLGGGVKSLFAFNNIDGTSKLIAAANGKLWDVSAGGVIASPLASGFSTDTWNAFNYKGAASRLLLYSGGDAPQQFDGTSLSAIGFSNGPGANIIGGTIWKSRQYLIPINSTSVWYTGVSNISGSLTEFDFGSFLKLGGYLVYAGTFTRDTGSVEADQFVVVSNMGEVLIYNGTSPADWLKVAHYFIPAPIGRRCMYGYGSDLNIITVDGTIPLSQVLQSNGAPDAFNRTSDNIRPTFNAAAAAFGGNPGFEAVVHNEGRVLMVNIPTVAGLASEQYIMNTLTGAWARYTGWNALSWATYKGGVYFGAPDGKVYQADYGANDNGSYISTDLEFAFNDLGDASVEKHWLLAKPNIVADHDAKFFFGLNTEFNRRPVINTIQTAGTSIAAPWDTSKWDQAFWDGSATYTGQWHGISGIGVYGSLRMKGDFQNVAMTLSSVQVAFEPGGIL